jgi:hypothetical protein
VRFSELDTAAASALFEVDVIGAMRMCHAVRPIMLQAGGNDEQPAAGALLALLAWPRVGVKRARVAVSSLADTSWTAATRAILMTAPPPPARAGRALCPIRPRSRSRR